MFMGASRCCRFCPASWCLAHHSNSTRGAVVACFSLRAHARARYRGNRGIGPRGLSDRCRGSQRAKVALSAAAGRGKNATAWAESCRRRPKRVVRWPPGCRNGAFVAREWPALPSGASHCDCGPPRASGTGDCSWEWKGGEKVLTRSSGNWRAAAFMVHPRLQRRRLGIPHRSFWWQHCQRQRNYRFPQDFGGCADC